MYGQTWHRISLLRLGVITQHKPTQTLITFIICFSNNQIKIIKKSPREVSYQVGPMICNAFKITELSSSLPKQNNSSKHKFYFTFSPWSFTWNVYSNIVWKLLHAARIIFNKTTIWTLTLGSENMWSIVWWCFKTSTELSFCLFVTAHNANMINKSLILVLQVFLAIGTT